MEELSHLGELPGDWEEVRLDLIESHQQLISAFLNSSRYLQERGDDVTFKPSTMKGKDVVEFLPTNLHVQRMWVSIYVLRGLVARAVYVGNMFCHVMSMR